jgi:3-oxoacyl-[acyl-carrier protein] reductase
MSSAATNEASTPSRVAVVTGGARGIGAAVAVRLASDGMAVAVVDLDEQASARTSDAITAAGGHAIAIGADVTDERAAAAAVERATAELGPVTVLINNAGILRDNLIFKMSLDDWDSVLGVHLRGAFLMTRAAQAQMVKAGWGRIVNLSSISAQGNRGQVNYSAAKAGMQGFTKTLAIELGRFGITANAIAPGFTETEMTRATAARMGVEFEEWKTAMARDIPVGRIGQPADIAALASFLCSEEAGFVSGQVIYVAGGPAD